MEMQGQQQGIPSCVAFEAHSSIHRELYVIGLSSAKASCKEYSIRRNSLKMMRTLLGGTDLKAGESYVYILVSERRY